MRGKIVLVSTIGLFLIVAFVVVFFNISLTSLPTTFDEFVEERIEKDKVLVMEVLDVERIDKIRIEAKTEANEVEIEDKEAIANLLNSELRIYNGGRYSESLDEYDLYVDYYGSIHRYTVAEDYIKTSDGNFKVLDKTNELYDLLVTLYDEN